MATAKTADERRRRKIERAITRQRKPATTSAATKRTPKWKRRKLTIKRLEKIVKTNGRYGDEHPGLHLIVKSPTNCSWQLRYWRDSRERWLGLGPLRLVDREEAVLKAKAAQRMLAGYTTADAAGNPVIVPPADPIQVKRAARAGGEGVTFKEACEAWLDVNRDNWKNEKFKSQADQIFRDFVYPKIGTVPIAQITKAHIIEVLEQRVPEEQGRPAGPFFKVRAETAKRCRLRLHGVIARAIDIGQRIDKTNPADWSGLKLAVPKPKPKPRDQRHHAALHYRHVPEFMDQLRSREGIAARALEFLILCGSRTGEVTGARWSEVDFEDKSWTIPASRMKTNEPHTVALSSRAISILRSLPREKGNDFIFVGAKAGQGLSSMSMLMLLKTRMDRSDLTVHGFRSTFKMWAATTNIPDEVSEHALSHLVGSEVRRAYAREEDFGKRRKLMELWTAYCATTPKAAGGNNVTPMRKRTA